MKTRRAIQLSALLLVLFLSMTLTACGGNQTPAQQSTSPAGESAAPASSEPAASAAPASEVRINFPNYMVGTNLGAPAMAKNIANFEAANPGVKIDMEEIPTDQAYLDKMKILASTGDLPDVLEGKNGLDDVLAKSGHMIDLKPYLDADADWKDSQGEGAIKLNTVNGKVYFASFTQGVAGYFYNKKYYDQVGIKPAETWDEFMSNCEKLKAAGITPIALGSSENAWTINLVFASMVGTSNQAGNDFMNTMYPKNFETPEIISGLAMIQTLLKDYTTSDAVGAAYANAANNFMQGKTAMIANGPWMIPDFKDDTKALPGFIDQVGISTYPGSGVFGAPQKGGYGVSDKNPDKLDVCVAFAKALTDVGAQTVNFESFGATPLSDKVKMSDEYRAENPLVAQLYDDKAKVKYTYAWFDIINYANVTDAFKNLYPELVYGQITPEEMAQQLSQVAQSNKE